MQRDTKRSIQIRSPGRDTRDTKRDERETQTRSFGRDTQRYIEIQRERKRYKERKNPPAEKIGAGKIWGPVLTPKRVP